MFNVVLCIELKFEFNEKQEQNMFKDISSFEVVPAFDNNPVQVARYFASGQRLTSVEFADTLGLQHYNLLRDVRKVLDKLTDENREFLCIEESSYKDSIGRELPLFIFGQEALEFFLIGIDVNYRASILRELYAYRDMVAKEYQRRAGRAENLVMSMQTFNKKSPYYRREDIRAIQREISYRR